MNIKKTRLFRRFNETKKEGKHFSKYYESFTTRNRAIRVFSPYMKEWDYDFDFNTIDTSAKRRTKQHLKVDEYVPVFNEETAVAKGLRLSKGIYQRISTGDHSSTDSPTIEIYGPKLTFEQTSHL